MKAKKKFQNQWILLTGLSGAGKSSALKVLEDQGYFAIDNLPVPLITPLLEFLKNSKKPVSKVVLGMDARGKEFLKSYQTVLATLEEAGIPFNLLYFDCKKKTLIRRFSESRRPHPLRTKGKTLEQAIDLEKKSLEPIKVLSSKVFDTSKMSIHQLKKTLLTYLSDSKTTPSLAINLISFGFKFGTPVEADMIFDVRFLANPHFVPKLKKQTGRSPSVKNYVLKQKDAQVFLRRLNSLLSFLIPRFKKEGKSSLSIALGCTGGRHRSVAMVEFIQKGLQEKKWDVVKIHRDLKR